VLTPAAPAPRCCIAYLTQTIQLNRDEGVEFLASLVALVLLLVLIRGFRAITGWRWWSVRN
jgi:hypothetical protein